MKERSKHLLWGILIMACSVAIAVWLRQRQEGFQTLAEPSAPYKTLNMDYTKEAFLYGFTGSPMTKADAAKACTDLGTTLATKAQLAISRDASGSWCNLLGAAGWVADDDAFLFCPTVGAAPTDLGTCSDGRAAAAPNCVKQYVPQNGKGYANCYGTKPAAGSTLGIQPHSTNAYSILDTLAVALTASGTGTDMLPYSFSPSQALFALEKTGFETRDQPPNGAKNARQFLLANLAPLNKNVRDVADPATKDTNEDMSRWADALAASCGILTAIESDMVAQLTALKQLMTTVQLRTRAVIGAKKENMNLQAEVAAICRGAVSPACSTLASIDFDIFYKEGGTQILSDLETLNYTLAQRECEIQKAALKLQILTDTFGCPAVAGSEILGNSRTAAGYYPNTCDPLTNDPVFKYFTGDNDTRFTVKKDLGYVPAEELKVAFEEISSYFDSPGYAPLFAKILDQLSILLRVPSLNDYATGSQNITTINDTITNIGKSLVRIFSA